MNNSNKKRLILLVLTLIMCLGVSYAAVYFVYLQEDTRENELQTGLISINYQEGSSLINLEDTVPVIDEIGLENEPYIFTVKNTSIIPINLKFEVIPNSNSQIPVGAIRYGLYINDELIKKGNLTNDEALYTLLNFEPNETINAKLILWVDYYYENPGETFSATVKVTGESFDIIYEEPITAATTIKSKIGTGGLIAINTDGDLYDANDTTQTIREYRYSGPTVDNYAYFNCKDTDGTYNYGDTNYDYANNCEVWRIIGIFDDNGEEKIKLVRNTVLTADELPESYVIGEATYKIASNATSSKAYLNSTKVGTNYTDWTTGGLQYYLNTEKDETDTSEGATANPGYLSLLTEEARDQISLTTYYLGNVYDRVFAVKLSYSQERGTIECTSSVTSDTHNNSCSIWNGNQAIWNGIIGLLYPSDYGYSASDAYWETDMYGWYSTESDGVRASTTSWMQQMPDHSSDSEWLLSPSSDYSHLAKTWDSAGGLGSRDASIYCSVRPVLHLTPSVKLLKGTGTDIDPYIFVK